MAGRAKRWCRFIKHGAVMAMLAPAVSAAAAPPLGAAAARVDAVVQRAGLAGEFALADRDGAVLDHAFGLADRHRQRAHRVGERWLWASVTKQVTAVLVLQQVEQHRLSLDGHVTDYLPEFAGPTGAAISLRDLLQHRSGLPNPDDTPADGGVPGFYRQRGPVTGNRPAARGWCSGPAKPAPSSGFAYNNCDYLVLGAILERVTHQPYAALVKQALVRPFRLTSLRLAGDGIARGGARAVGYGEGGKPAPAVNVATFGASAALTGTARDLVGFDRALLGGQLLRPESLALAWHGEPTLGYEALGVWAYPARLAGCAQPVTLIERRGDVGGIAVRNVIVPATGRVFALFLNDDSVDFGEVWQGRGLMFDLLSAALCPG